MPHSCVKVSIYTKTLLPGYSYTKYDNERRRPHHAGFEGYASTKSTDSVMDTLLEEIHVVKRSLMTQCEKRVEFDQRAIENQANC